jgi:hypothetical protein
LQRFPGRLGTGPMDAKPGGKGRRCGRLEAVVAEVVEAVILISVIFLMGLALGVVATVVIGRRKDGSGPP